MIRGGLGSRVRRVWGVWRLLAEIAFVPQGTEDLISGHVQEAESRLLGAIKSAPITQTLLEQRESSGDVRPDEFARSVNGAVDMRLCRQMNYCIRAPLLKQPPQAFGVADINALKHMS